MFEWMGLGFDNGVILGVLGGIGVWCEFISWGVVYLRLYLG